MMPVSRVAWLTSPVPLLLFAAVLLLLLLLLCALPVPGNECDVVPLMPLPMRKTFLLRKCHLNKPNKRGFLFLFHNKTKLNVLINCEAVAGLK